MNPLYNPHFLVYVMFVSYKPMHYVYNLYEVHCEEGWAKFM